MELSQTNPFASFWMAGYECTDQLNSTGNRVDLINTTQHLSRLQQDYQQLQPFGIKTVREGIRWSFVERHPYQYDFSIVKKMLAQARESGTQQIWDICHFGFPDDLSPLHPHFTKRFTCLCEAFVKFYMAECPGQTLIVTPINEVSFLSWLGGEAAGTAPYCKNNGWEVKYALMRAYISGIKAIKAICPGIRILTTEPIVNIVPALNASDAEKKVAAQQHEEQFQSLDILAGTICPELGGSPDLLDILGFNFYYNNQWVVGFNEFLPWFNENNDERWLPLSQLLKDAYARYQKPLVITETSHPGIDRPGWIDFITRQCRTFLAENECLWGVCLYPIIDRPDWDDLSCWHHSGLWDEVFQSDGTSERVLYQPFADALLKTQQLLAENINPNA